LRPDERGAYHVLSIVANDRPGLLYAVARVLAQHGVSVHTAKVNTLGDRAEDVFLVSGEAIAHSRQALQIEQLLLRELQA
ncbi:MAG: ACT domain-containing protein, partial [Betaproteobacteria bacterium]|nr:ACT domain-containing protein [Betaproteobacteria bacterium]